MEDLAGIAMAFLALFSLYAMHRFARRRNKAAIASVEDKLSLIIEDPVPIEPRYSPYLAQAPPPSKKELNKLEKQLFSRHQGKKPFGPKDLN